MSTDVPQEPFQIPVAVAAVETPGQASPVSNDASTNSGGLVMPGPDYIDNTNTSVIATALAGTVKQMIDGAQFGLESLRLGHEQAMSQFGPIAAAAQRTIDESGSGRARDLQQAPVVFQIPKTA